MTEAIEALQPQLVVIENVRGLLSSPAVRAPLEGDDDAQHNPDHATPGDATLRGLEPDPWSLGDLATRPLRAAGAVLGDLADMRYDAQWIGLPASLVGAPHPRLRIFILARRQGRPAPAPALLTGDTGPRPAPEFVEWLMGLEAGWVTDVGHELSPNQQLAALGNGVLPLQATAALKNLL